MPETKASENASGEKQVILWQNSWYPSTVDIYTGDFQQRHARAASIYNSIVSVFVVKRAQEMDEEVVENHDGSLHEYIVYYKEKFRSGTVLSRLASAQSYIAAHRRILRHIVKTFGKPALIQVGVAWKAGLVALALKKLKGWKYIVMEHWGGYSRALTENIYTVPAHQRYLTKSILNNAEAVIAVSQDQADQINAFNKNTKCTIVPNVVDTHLFSPVENKRRKIIRLVHSSMLDEVKNIMLIVEAVRQLSVMRNDFEFYIIGPQNAEVETFLKRHDLLGKRAFITGLQDYAGVARQLKQADIMIHFSSYEALPCVVLEALCSGVAVISSAVGGIPEVITESNGRLVPKLDLPAFIAAINEVINNLEKFDRYDMAKKSAALYSYETVGKTFSGIYRDITGKL
ncbi:MAG: glycosyltransferase family 4 protein [Gemmatimonadaceae bacterium]|nr:glycosyltransferase family 4 protein [Chitinophagaceae bacterium]